MKEEKLKELYKVYAKKGYLSKEDIKGYERYVESKRSSYIIKEKYRKKIKVYVTGGVFEILHYGHIEFLRRAKNIAKNGLLVVVIARDEHILKKRKRIITPQKYRVKMLEAIKYVDVVVKGLKNKDKIIERLKPYAIIYGYDQKELKLKGVKNIRIRKISNYSSNKILSEGEYGI